MNPLVRLALSVLFAAGLTGVAVAAVAVPAGDVPRHQHFVNNGDELVRVGPDVCSDPSLQHAFNQFHAHVHIGTPGTFAMDHEHNRTDIAARPC